MLITGRSWQTTMTYRCMLPLSIRRYVGHATSTFRISTSSSCRLDEGSHASAEYTWTNLHLRKRQAPAIRSTTPSTNYVVHAYWNIQASQRLYRVKGHNRDFSDQAMQRLNVKSRTPEMLQTRCRSRICLPSNVCRSDS